MHTHDRQAASNVLARPSTHSTTAVTFRTLAAGRTNEQLTQNLPVWHVESRLADKCLRLTQLPIMVATVAL
jgi:hypothetical protein